MMATNGMLKWVVLVDVAGVTVISCHRLEGPSLFENCCWRSAQFIDSSDGFNQFEWTSHNSSPTCDVSTFSSSQSQRKRGNATHAVRNKNADPHDRKNATIAVVEESSTSSK